MSQSQQNELCTQQRFSLGIRPLWSESSLYALSVAKDPNLFQADSEHTAWMSRLICVFAEGTYHFVGFVTLWLISLYLYYLYIIWVMSWENLFMPYANNKGADQLAHPHSLISTFVVHCLYSLIPILAISKVLRLQVASEAEQAGLSLTWLETPGEVFLRCSSNEPHCENTCLQDCETRHKQAYSASEAS